MSSFKKYKAAAVEMANESTLHLSTILTKRIVYALD